MNYTNEQIERWKSKAEKWDALEAQISKCYFTDQDDQDGYPIQREEDDDEGGDLITIGEIAAKAFGHL